ncbi:DUF1538 domain-containing protein [Natronospirillum operosum]|uniref:DUF1538 domain-containing protein n=2 Tax=Natronospirillum operosum TaxID=2759953 RepID=A0A4Z0WCQ3_9GAMM|nr:DUF1538 domain-containing protein [Natronospirillum operosum]
MLELRRLATEGSPSTVPFVVSFGRQILDSTKDLMPVILVVLFFQVLVLRQPLPETIAAGQVLIGLICVVIGLALFVRGLELGLFPAGEGLANAFVRKGSAFWLLLFAFALGFGTTVAEPALMAVAVQAERAFLEEGLILQQQLAPGRVALALRGIVALSVGSAIVLGVLRILKGWPLHWLIIGGYMIALALTAVAPAPLIGIAYDSGGVTTSTITVPLVTALGVGLATSIKGRNPITDGFGLIAFASVMPIIFVLALGSLGFWWLNG